VWALCGISKQFLEEKFCELRLFGVLRRSEVGRRAAVVRFSCPSSYFSSSGYPAAVSLAYWPATLLAAHQAAQAALSEGATTTNNKNFTSSSS
jgi:hypothetical protein